MRSRDKNKGGGEHEIIIKRRGKNMSLINVNSLVLLAVQDQNWHLG